MKETDEYTDVCTTERKAMRKGVQSIIKKNEERGVPLGAQWVKDLTSNHEDVV